MSSKFKNFTVAEEIWTARVREERRKTLRLLAWLAFWVALFTLLHALT